MRNTEPARNGITRTWHSAAQLLFGVAALALVTWLCYRLRLSLATTAFAYLILVVLLSLTGSSIPLILAILAVGFLNYFFAPSAFDLRVEEPVEVIAFFITSLVVIGLVRRGRTLAVAALDAQESVREQAGLLELTHDTVFVRDMNDTITYWNRGAEELYGWKAAEAVGKVTHQLLQTTFPEPLEKITDILRRAGRWEGEIVHTKRDGTRVTVASRWALRQDDQARPIAILETNNDVTARKEAEEALRESEEQWKAVFEHNPTMYFMVDAAGTVVSVNSFGAQQLGYTIDELVGHSVLTVFPEADRGAVQTHVGACFDHLGRLASWELRKVRKDGTTLWVRETAKAVVIKGRPIVLIVCEDVTETRRASEALVETQAQLAHVARVTTLGEVTASLAHEVNQPLAAIVNNANACLGLLPDGGDLDEVREAMADIVSDGERASAIIERVRGLAKRSSPQKVPLRLRDVVADVLALAAAESSTRSVAIRTDVGPGLPVVLGDRVQLQQVLLNLVVNGMDAMSDVAEGERRLEIRGRPDTQDGAPAALLSVQDHGIGLEAAQVDSIFEAFYTTKPHGMGMGLAISRSIIEGHGGRLWADRNQGPGATFSFRLPAAPPAAS
jgi:PAS domain S-box-containing protein